MGAGPLPGLEERLVTHYLVVAHKTLIGEHLLAEAQKRMDQGPSEVHLVVPVTHPVGAWSQGSVDATARERLSEGLEAFRAIGATADGMIGDVSPPTAVEDALRAHRNAGLEIDEIILSTLPPGPSRWLKLDVLSRVHERTDLPVTHLVAERSASI